VKTTPEVQRIFTLTAQMEDEAAAALDARKEALDLIAKGGNKVVVRKFQEIAPEEAPQPAGAGRGGGTGSPSAPASPATLTDISGRLVGSLMAMQAAEIAPTAAKLDACAKQQAVYATLMAKWTVLMARARERRGKP
jgi:hypothetical protein